MVDPMSVTLLDENMFRLNRLSTAALLIFLMVIRAGLTLTCHRTEYEFRGECCPMCLPGTRVKTDCEVDKLTSCLLCTEGTYMDKLNSLKSCFPCTECDEGSGLRIKRICSRTADALCEPTDGFYCTEPTEDGCRTATRHKSCGPGESVSQKGSSHSDTKCSPCPAGTFSNGTSASCQPHTHCKSLNLRLLKPGTESEDAQCGEQTSRTVIVSIVIAVIFLLVIVVLAAVLLFKKRKKRSQRNQTYQNGVLTGERTPDSPNSANNHPNETDSMLSQESQSPEEQV